MSLPVKNLKCLSPVMCQCKVICSNRTLSLMFGCKVSWAEAAASKGLEEMCRGRVESVHLQRFDCRWIWTFTTL